MTKVRKKFLNLIKKMKYLYIYLFIFPHIFLSFSHLGVCYLCESLRDHPSIRSVSICDNNVGEKGGLAIGKTKNI